MKVLLIGSGGREHALYWKIKQSPALTSIFVHPGNGGIDPAHIAALPEPGPDRDSASDLPYYHRQIREFIHQENIDLLVVGPEQPLVEGLTDHVKDLCPVFGPDAYAASLEGSKSFAKDFMARHSIPTAQSFATEDLEEALRFLEGKHAPVVVKADGLAAGKGVTVAGTIEQAKQAVTESLQENRFGDSGRRVVIEDFLEGKEASVFAICDGKRALAFVPARDYKRAGENDTGPNTGGMGSFAPVTEISQELREQIHREVIVPVLRGMESEGHPYRGLLYAGLMIHNNSVNVVEFNCRFGDPETQPLMLLLDDDLLNLLHRAATGNLEDRALRFHNASAVTVVLAAEGYPGSYPKGIALHPSLLEEVHSQSQSQSQSQSPGRSQVEGENESDVVVFHAGTSRTGDASIQSSGGRILAVTARGDTVADARRKVYSQIDRIQVEGTFCRRDIAEDVS